MRGIVVPGVEELGTVDWPKSVAIDDAGDESIGDKRFVDKALVEGKTLIGLDSICLLFAVGCKSAERALLPLIFVPNLALDDDVLDWERIGDDDGFMRMLSLSVSSSTSYIMIGCALVYDF